MNTALGDISKNVQLDLLIANLSGSEEVAVMVVDEFLVHVASQLDDVRQAIASKDGDRICKAAHRHKGSLAAIHAVPAREVAAAIERAGHTNDPARAEELFATLTTLSVELVQCLRRWRAEH